jgi:hypothetical protein
MQFLKPYTTLGVGILLGVFAWPRVKGLIVK